ncbi:MAG: undecaprenyl/decaprenyl-phosphate alpha-N-acetylglucosaminyl 1-phosphate transferase [Candidatus Moranbacteria bacterium]|nr:undecaprenyl/decaprenyl-phosphate alpha-N-acetylglucosaminyl 1-phosphate transferase [Candidatus Moranbacteria bacterium]
MNWLIFFLMAFALSSGLSFGLVNWSKNKSKNFFRVGGIAIISSFIMVFLIVSEIVITSQLTAVLVGSIAILIFGFWDDIKSFNWKTQILFQLFLALILVWFGFEINLISFSGKELLKLDYWNLVLWGKSFSIISSLFIGFWLVGIINVVNWLDGSDGLLSMAGVLSLLAVFLVSLRPEVNQPALAIISLIGIGSLSGFFIFNFPSAKIEAGTSGSYFVGFLLATLAIIAGTKIATTMVILILPVTDFVWVIIERVREKQSIFEKDNKKRHLHYKLLKMGFSPKQVLLGYALFLSLALLISFFVVNQTQKILLLVIEFIMILLFMSKGKLILKKWF